MPQFARRTSSSMARSGFIIVCRGAFAGRPFVARIRCRGRTSAIGRSGIRDRLKLLVECMAVELCDYAVLSNHVPRRGPYAARSGHDVVGRGGRPAVVAVVPAAEKEGRDGERARRSDLDVLMADAEAIEEKRRRLSEHLLVHGTPCANGWLVRRTPRTAAAGASGRPVQMPGTGRRRGRPRVQYVRRP